MVARADVLEYPAYILAAVDELVYGYHAIFILIHLLLDTVRKEIWKTNKEVLLKPYLLWLTNTELWMLPTTHLPERKPLHADEASPLWGQGTCIFPSCHRWPSWCLASPATQETGQFTHAFIRYPLSCVWNMTFEKWKETMPLLIHTPHCQQLSLKLLSTGRNNPYENYSSEACGLYHYNCSYFQAY